MRHIHLMNCWILIMLFTTTAGLAALSTEDLYPGAVDRAFETTAKELVSGMPAQLGKAKIAIQPDSYQVPEKFVKAIIYQMKIRFPDITILDRDHLLSTLKELGRTLEDYTSKRNAPEMKRIEVAQVIVFVHVPMVSIFWEYADIEADLSAVDVETGGLYWQSKNVRTMRMWVAIPLILIIVAIVLIIKLIQIGVRNSHKRSISRLVIEMNEVGPKIKIDLQSAMDNFQTLYINIQKKNDTKLAVAIKAICDDLSILSDKTRFIAKSAFVESEYDRLEQKAEHIKKIRSQVEFFKAKSLLLINKNNEGTTDIIVNELPDIHTEVSKLETLFNELNSFK